MPPILYDEHIFDIVPEPQVEATYYNFLLMNNTQREWVYRHIDYCILGCCLEDFKTISCEGGYANDGVGFHDPYLTSIHLTAGGTFGDDSRTCGLSINSTLLGTIRRSRAPSDCPIWVTVVPLHAYLGHLSVMVNDNELVENLDRFILHGSRYLAHTIQKRIEQYFNTSQRINEYHDFQMMASKFEHTFSPDDEED